MELNGLKEAKVLALWGPTVDAFASLASGQALISNASHASKVLALGPTLDPPDACDSFGALDAEAPECLGRRRRRAGSKVLGPLVQAFGSAESDPGSAPNGSNTSIVPPVLLIQTHPLFRCLCS